MRGKLVGNRHAEHLHGGQPRREGTCVVLEQHGEEAFDGAEQGAVNHHRALVGAVLRDVLELEALRQVEVELDGRDLPGAADGVAGLHRDLRAVEGGAARIVDELEVGFLGDLGERVGGLLPDLVGADVLVRVLGGQLEVEVGQAKVLEQVQHEGEQAGELVLHLLAGAVDVGVVLGEAAHAGQAVDLAGLLVAVHGAELEEAQRQLAVGALTGLEDQVVHRAVHRLQVVVGARLGDVAVRVLLLVEVHGRVHAVLVPVQVAGGLVQAALGDVRGLHEAVVVLAVHLTGVVLHSVDHGGTLRVEHGQAGANFIREGEQVHLGAELAVIALGSFFQAGLVGLEVFLGGPCGAVDALHGRVLLGTTPVGGGGTLDLEGLDVAGVRQVRTAAQVLPNHIAITVYVVVEAELLFGDLGGGGRVEVCFLVFDQFDLKGLVGLFLQSLFLSHGTAAEGLGGLDDALHALLDVLEVVRGEGLVDLEVVVEAVLDDGADAELGVRVDFLHGLGHDVGGRVTHDCEAVFGVEGDGVDGVAIVQRRVQVTVLAVDLDRDDVLVFREQFYAGGGCFHLLRFAVDGYGDGSLRHDLSFAIGAHGTNVQAWTG